MTVSDRPSTISWARWNGMQRTAMADFNWPILAVQLGEAGAKLLLCNEFCAACALLARGAAGCTSAALPARLQPPALMCCMSTTQLAWVSHLSRTHARHVTCSTCLPSQQWRLWELQDGRRIAVRAALQLLCNMYSLSSCRGADYAAASWHACCKCMGLSWR